MAQFFGVVGVFASFAGDARVNSGMLRLFDRPGSGFEAQSALHAVMRTLV